MYNIVSDCGLQLCDSSCLTGYEPYTLVTQNFLSLLSLEEIFLLHSLPPIHLQKLLLLTSFPQNTKPTPIAFRPSLEPLHHLEWGDEGSFSLQKSLVTCGWQGALPHHCRPRPDCLGHQAEQSSWWAHAQHHVQPESPYPSRPGWPHKGLKYIEEGLHPAEGQQLFCGIWWVLQHSKTPWGVPACLGCLSWGVHALNQGFVQLIFQHCYTQWWTHLHGHDSSTWAQILTFHIIPCPAHRSRQRQGQGCFLDWGNQSMTLFRCCSYPTCWLSTLSIITHLSMSPKLTLLILWQARPLRMQLLFTVTHQKVLQVKQEQGQEAGPGPGCKFVTYWIPGGTQVSRKYKSLF